MHYTVLSYRFGRLITVKRNTTLLEAFELLINNHLLSVPVVDEAGEAVSILSMLDIMNHLVNEFSEKDLKGLTSTNPLVYFIHHFHLKDKKKDIAKEQVGDVLNKEIQEVAKLDPVVLIDSTASLLDAIQVMVANKAHRVGVYNKESGAMVNLITQSRMLQYLNTILYHLPESERTLRDLKIGNTNVVCIEEDAMAINAFKCMKEHRVSGVGIVNKEGKLVGNFSVSDLKLVGFNLEYFQYLSKPIKDYLNWLNGPDAQKETIRKQLLVLNQNEKGQVMVTCRIDDTLGAIIKKINYFEVHRVYAVDEEGKPIAVISIHDILETLVKARQTAIASSL